MGRWPYLAQVDAPAPPPMITARTMTVVCGRYTGAKRLPEAETEADNLARTYRGVPVEGLGRAVLRCLQGEPPGDIAHFAMHGKVDAGGTQDGLLMVDGQWLDWVTVRGVEKLKPRLVFLNACQVGQGQQVLGDYAGLAPALLTNGASAVVAPLWKVNDAVAHVFAEGFYQAVLVDKVAPAEYLRRQRAAVRHTEGLPAGTVLAYLFFGHPLLHVEWTRGDHADV